MGRTTWFGFIVILAVGYIVGVYYPQLAQKVGLV